MGHYIWISTVDTDKYFEHYIRDSGPREETWRGALCQIQYFLGEHKNEFLVQNGNEIRHYRQGLLNGVWAIQNDEVVGDFERLHDGCALYRQEWTSLQQDFWIQTVNRKECCRKEIVDAQTQQVIYIGGINENGEKTGRGVVFKEGIENPEMEGIWEANELKIILTLFKGDKMIRFDNAESNLDVFSRIPIYCGEYWYDSAQNTFLRNGIGYEIDKNGVAGSKKEWKKGIEVRSCQLKDGWYIIHDNPLKNDPKSVNLVIPPHAYHYADCLNLSCYKNAETIEIGEYNFMNVDHFKVQDMDTLQKLKINKFSFYKNDRKDRFIRTFAVTNCKNLQSIILEAHSFHYFSNRFELCELPSLEYLKIGDLNIDSACFSYCNIEIQSLLFCCVSLRFAPLENHHFRKSCF